MLGIPNEAMALIQRGVDVETIGDIALAVRNGADIHQLDPAEHVRLP